MIALVAMVGCRPAPTTTGSDTGGTPATHTAVGPERQWQKLHDYPCAMDADGLVECFWPADWGDWSLLPFQTGVQPPPVAVSTITTANSLWGVARDTDLPVVLVFEAYDLQAAIPNVTGFTDITHDCARRNSEILCFDQVVGEEVFPPDRSYRRLGGEFLSWVGLDTTNRLTVRVYRYPAENLAYEVTLPDGLEVVDLAVVQESACVLATTGDVSCHGGPLDGQSPLPEPGPYRRFFGRTNSACGVLMADDRIVCNDGTTYDWGPLRDVVVTLILKQVVQGGQTLTVSGGWGDPPSLCAITDRNRVRCVGGQYDLPALQAALPPGDDAP